MKSTKQYHPVGKSLCLGCAKLGEEVFTDQPVQITCKTLNRHGLIAGATGTGKTKTLQLLAGMLSSQGVPMFLMDFKGDLSGIAKAGEENSKIRERHKKLRIPFTPRGHPTQFLTLSDAPGARLRATISEFGPLLLAKMLGLNDTQETILSIIFKYCDDRELPLIDLKDLKSVIKWLTTEGKKELKSQYGQLSSTSVSAIQRRIVRLEQQKGEQFFGEPAFAIEDLMRHTSSGEGYISVLRLMDIQDRPELFSSFMLSLLATVYHALPEVGDPEQPKLVLVFDEAHLLFKHASKELLSQMETIVKLIRSKGVGIFFCTQSAADIPAPILSQLGLKIQHSLRAFTAKDRKKIKITAENFPVSDRYQIDRLLTEMGTGEALITALTEEGHPTETVYTLLVAPDSRMGPLTSAELEGIVKESALTAKYQKSIDRESAHERLQTRMQQAQEIREQQEIAREQKKLRSSSWYKLLTSVGVTLTRELVRGIFGVLGLGKKRR